MSVFIDSEQRLAGQLFELNRKYNKSVTDGWRTNLDSSSVASTYSSAVSSIFDKIPTTWDKWKNAPSPETASCRMWQKHQPISDENIKAAVDYLDLISPINSSRA